MSLAFFHQNRTEVVLRLHYYGKSGARTDKHSQHNHIAVL